MPRHLVHRAARKRGHFIESMEQRVLLTSGLAWTDANNLTLSFAPDGTNVAGHESNLHQLMDAVADRGAWRTAMRQGFEKWTSLVDADISVVNDGGQAFGTAGATYADPRFGDIRIAAIPINEDVFAMSIPHDEFVAGTWAGDIIFNSNADFASADDVFRVLLHEAGHVVGLDHSTDPNSPMFEHGIPSSIEPTAEDAENLREVYGIEKDDDEGDREQKESDEDDEQNDQFASATVLNPTNGFTKRRYTLEGRIEDDSDVDIYKFQGYEDADSELEVTTFVLRSTERGRLLPKITLHDEEGQRIDEVTILQNGNGTLVLQTEEVDPDENYFIKIRSAVNGDERGQGDYHLTVSSRAEEIEPREFADGTLSEEEKESLHTVYLGRAQLISMSIVVDPENAHQNTAVGIALFDHKGDLITSTSAGVGETRSLDTMLLRAGKYYVSVKAESDAAIPDLDYELLAIKVTREAGPLPTDPTGDPAFPCNDGTPDFCFPDGHRSSDPTHTVPGTVDPPPELDRYAILLSWLSWWPEENPNAGWVDPNGDHFMVPQGTSTSLDVQQNDSGTPAIELRSVTQPGDGSTSINEDGTIEFVAPAGFNGTTTFEYSIGAEQAVVDTTLASGDRFGSSVAAYGNLAVVGAPFSDEVGSDSGAAYVFRQQAGSWVLEQKLTPADGAANDRFGAAVAVHGTTIVVTSPRDDDFGRNSGSAYVFEFDPTTTTFVEGRKINDPKGKAKDLFGESVAIDGSTLVVGARLDDGLGTNSGSAFVFNRNRGGADNWGLRKKLKASNAAAFAQFGAAVDISGDIVVVGARRDDASGVNSGSAYVFARDQGGTNKFGEVTRLAPSGVNDRDEFGTDVGLSGTTVVVGSPLNDAGGKNAGAAHVFSQDEGGSGQWGEQARYNGLAAGDFSGTAVTIDGGVLAVSSPGADQGPSNSGMARVYRFDAASSAWVPDYDVTADVSAMGDQVGSSLDVFAGTLLLGAPRSDGQGSLSGHLVVEDTRRASAQVSVEVGSPLQVREVGSVSEPATATYDQLQREAYRAFDAWGVEPVEFSIQFADLDGGLIGLTIGSRILIDIDAAGYGWFSTVQSSPAGISLGTVVTHEVGHLLGLDDTFDEADSGKMMYGYLEPGEQRKVSGTVALEPSLIDTVFRRSEELDLWFEK